MFGGFTGEEKIEIVALLTKHEYADLFKFMKDNEIDGFITAGSVSEVYGNWRSGKVRYESPKPAKHSVKQA